MSLGPDSPSKGKTVAEDMATTVGTLSFLITGKRVESVQNLKVLGSVDTFWVESLKITLQSLWEGDHLWLWGP